MKLEETIIHFAVADYLRLFAKPECLWFHCPNGGRMSIARGRKLKRMGVLPGVSDFCFVYGGKFYALELKADKGRMSEHQMAFQDRVNTARGYTACAVGIDAALKVLRAWGLVTQ